MLYNIGDKVENFELKTFAGNFMFNDFDGYFIIFTYSKRDNVSLTELCWLSRQVEGFKQFGINLLVIILDEDIKSLCEKVLEITGSLVMYLIISNAIDFLLKTGKTIYFLDKKREVYSIISYLLNVGYNMIEIFRLSEADRLKDIGLETPCNWMGLNEMTWEDKEIVSSSVKDSDIKKRFGLLVDFFGIKFIKRELNA